jgi:hypothetical protein
MLAQAFLAVTARASRPGARRPRNQARPAETTSRPTLKGDLSPVDSASPRQGHTPRQPS